MAYIFGCNWSHKDTNTLNILGELKIICSCMGVAWKWWFKTFKPIAFLGGTSKCILTQQGSKSSLSWLRVLWMEPWLRVLFGQLTPFKVFSIPFWRQEKQWDGCYGILGFNLLTRVDAFIIFLFYYCTEVHYFFPVKVKDCIKRFRNKLMHLHLVSIFIIKGVFFSCHS